MHDERRFAARPIHGSVHLVLLLAQAHGTDAAGLFERDIECAVGYVFFYGVEIWIDVVPLVDSTVVHMLDTSRNNSAYSRDVIGACLCDVDSVF